MKNNKLSKYIEISTVKNIYKEIYKSIPNEPLEILRLTFIGTQNDLKIFEKFLDNFKKENNIMEKLWKVLS